jgi:four helix bundle protein
VPATAGRRIDQTHRATTGAGSADFIHKVGIANKELREALYWLQLTEEAALHHS